MRRMVTGGVPTYLALAECRRDGIRRQRIETALVGGIMRRTIMGRLGCAGGWQAYFSMRSIAGPMAMLLALAQQPASAQETRATGSEAQINFFIGVAPGGG